MLVDAATARNLPSSVGCCVRHLWTSGNGCLVLNPQAYPAYNPVTGGRMRMRKSLFACAFLGAGLLVPSLWAQGPAAKPGTAKPGTAARPSTAQKGSLVAQGKARFQAYKCYDCHGKNGEGTEDAPNLTHSKLTEEQVSKFLVKPSVDAQNKGMPDIPADNPDHKSLVAYVMSLRAK
jgi:mono/diheme cytochrome c family protein